MGLFNQRFPHVDVMKVSSWSSEFAKLNKRKLLSLKINSACELCFINCYTIDMDNGSFCLLNFDNVTPSLMTLLRQVCSTEGTGNYWRERIGMRSLHVASQTRTRVILLSTTAQSVVTLTRLVKYFCTYRFSF